ncbi:MAG: ASCH domain-containing protein [Ruminococcus sp.]|nr:ASCH domain-containing protein [Ruminococcus sp.]
MNLWHDPFEMIKAGTKTIEMRLYDEKRSKIAVGDVIVFTDADNGEELECSVLNLYRYANFDEMYQNHDKVSIGYKSDELALPSDMLQYYSEEQIEKYGAVGIEINVL